jgi:hypothetical protein
MNARRARRIEGARKRLVDALKQQARLAYESATNPAREREHQIAAAATAKAEAQEMMQ